MTAPQILPGCSPAGTPPDAGLPVPVWPPADYTVLGTYTESYAEGYGTVVLTTTVQVLPG
jgi:hypothetical protein